MFPWNRSRTHQQNQLKFSCTSTYLLFLLCRLMDLRFSSSENDVQSHCIFGTSYYNGGEFLASYNYATLRPMTTPLELQMPVQPWSKGIDVREERNHWERRLSYIMSFTATWTLLPTHKNAQHEASGPNIRAITSKCSSGSKASVSFPNDSFLPLHRFLCFMVARASVAQEGLSSVPRKHILGQMDIGKKIFRCLKT
jgi:hypothetical protein